VSLPTSWCRSLNSAALDATVWPIRRTVSKEQRAEHEACDVRDEFQSYVPLPRLDRENPQRSSNRSRSRAYSLVTDDALAAASTSAWTRPS
jgi:hypothetical protein